MDTNSPRRRVSACVYDVHRESARVCASTAHGYGGVDAWLLGRRALRAHVDGAHRGCAHVHAPRSRAYGHAYRSEEHTSELQSLMRISYAVFCLNKKKKKSTTIKITNSSN